MMQPTRKKEGRGMDKRMRSNSPDKKRAGIVRTFRRDWMLWAMVLPAVLAVLVFNYWPMYGIQLAFREYSFKTGLTGGKFVGLKYFSQFVHNYQFKTLIGNTLRISLTNILLGFPMPVILALLLNQPRSKNSRDLCRQSYICLILFQRW